MREACDFSSGRGKLWKIVIGKMYREEIAREAKA
jgi:hypothetical protein